MLIQSINKDRNKYKSKYQAILRSIKEDEKKQNPESQMSEGTIKELA